MASRIIIGGGNESPEPLKKPRKTVGPKKKNAEPKRYEGESIYFGTIKEEKKETVKKNGFFKNEISSSSSSRTGVETVTSYTISATTTCEKEKMPLQEIKIDSVKKKVFLDLFADPTTVIPVGIGLTMLIGSWAISGPSFWTFAGFCTILVGIGTLVTRLVFGIEKIAKNAQEFVANAQKNNEEFKLEQLRLNLGRDGMDRRGSEALRELRELKNSFNKAIEEGKITGAAKGLMVEKMETLFEACVKQLSNSCDLYVNSCKLRGAAKKAIDNERENVLVDVQKTVELMANVLQQCFSSKSEIETEKLAGLREELRQSLEIAKSTDQQMKEFGDKPVYKEEDFK